MFEKYVNRINLVDNFQYKAKLNVGHLTIHKM